MKRFVLPCLLCCSMISFGQDIRHVADSIRLRRRVPALTYAVFTADSIRGIGAVGYKRLRTKDTVSLYNRYHIGTATASFTAYIAAKLVAANKITWNTSLFKIFPTLKTKATAAHGDITLVDLLTHRTGLLTLNNYLE